MNFTVYSQNMNIRKLPDMFILPYIVFALGWEGIKHIGQLPQERQQIIIPATGGVCSIPLDKRSEAAVGLQQKLRGVCKNTVSVEKASKQSGGIAACRTAAGGDAAPRRLLPQKRQNPVHTVQSFVDPRNIPLLVNIPDKNDLLEMVLNFPVLGQMEPFKAIIPLLDIRPEGLLVIGVVNSVASAMLNQNLA